MIVSEYKIEELQVLAYQAEQTNTNIPFTGRQIREIIRIIMDLRSQIKNLENKQQEQDK